MITSIVRGVQQTLQATSSDKKPEVEIIFPVSADAVATEGSELVPGVQGGEGCSSAGGCATCPFMKMNDLEALFEVAEGVDLSQSTDPLSAYRPQQYTELIQGRTVSELGVHPILHMRSFMENQSLSDKLVKDIQTRKPGVGCPEARE